MPKSEVEAMLNIALQSFSSSDNAINDLQKPSTQRAPKESKPKQESESSIEDSRDIASEAKQFAEKEVEREKKREHRLLQEFIKKVGEERNFKAIIEAPVNDGAGKIDVALHHDHIRIACEVSVTNTPEYELHNIQKCL
ncbi:MAG: hypothetical protein R3301_18125, partial [Saprospiraceae bacterium]|nr:hypothetical protein [Saprospiraceae bacterium]